MPDKEIREGRKPIPAGVGLIFGAAVGVVLSTLLDNPVWIGLGAGLGIVLGGGYGRLR